jgi:hypothetical protein
MELSAVTIPANAEATITAIKSADCDARARLASCAAIVGLETQSIIPAFRVTYLRKIP